jgi:hypothetical protein
MTEGLRCSWSHIGDRATVRAATGVNAEQSSKRTMCRPTQQRYRGKLLRLGEMSENDAQPLHRNSSGTFTRKTHATREAPKRGQLRNERTNWTPVRDRPSGGENCADARGAVGRSLKLGQRQRRAQFEAARSLLVRDRESGQEGALTARLPRA